MVKWHNYSGIIRKLYNHVFYYVNVQCSIWHLEIKGLKSYSDRTFYLYDDCPCGYQWQGQLLQRYQKQNMPLWSYGSPLLCCASFPSCFHCLWAESVRQTHHIYVSIHSTLSCINITEPSWGIFLINFDTHKRTSLVPGTNPCNKHPKMLLEVKSDIFRLKQIKLGWKQISVKKIWQSVGTCSKDKTFVAFARTRP